MQPAGAGVTAPSCSAPLVASRQNPRQVRSALGSAIENLRYLLSVKANTYYPVNSHMDTEAMTHARLPLGKETKVCIALISVI